MAGPNFYRGQYEFQCLHGMGEPLYEQVVGVGTLDRPCRVYAPVGTHETLLAYLVRRLLENGANSSFVNRIADAAIPIDDLLADPVATVRASAAPGSPHERIALPRDLYGIHRRNSAGLDLSNEDALADIIQGLNRSRTATWQAAPMSTAAGQAEPVLNPADRREIVGHARAGSEYDIAEALTTATAAASGWGATNADHRAAILRRAADTMEGHATLLIGLVVREAGKTFANAMSEVREAVDFLRYYAAEAVRTLGDGRHQPLGPVVCISPWNFPLVIFTGQVGAALAAGNAVLAKPAEQTPLVAAEVVRILHAAGIPDDVLRLVPGDGDVGATLVGDARVQGVMFTGSTAVARKIQRQLADRLTRTGQPVPLVAETGGQNAMVVDSSALAEQVVTDVIASAFDSAGQRCSALRILCLQEEIADRTIAMLKGSMHELRVGNPDRLATDVGPVISAEAQASIERHVEVMRARGHAVERLALSAETVHGTFVPPTLIEIGRITDVEHEVFGPILHILRFRRENLDVLIAEINATGYALTFGLHTRIDETIARVLDRIEAGNVYVNRNTIGATVGVQPFGGSGLSGTGPKAGGPLYLGRLLASPPTAAVLPGLIGSGPGLTAARAYADWLRAAGRDAEARRVVGYLSPFTRGAPVELPGPVGERNVYALHPRGQVAAMSRNESGLLAEVGAILATGNIAVIEGANPARAVLATLPEVVAVRIETLVELDCADRLRAVLTDAEGSALVTLNRRIAAWGGPIIAVHALPAGALDSGQDYDLTRLCEEVTVTTNTAAAGGNARLMSIG